jgi:nucleotide-binding universal stress UspA family protein
MGCGFGDASTSALAGIGAWPDLALTLVHVAWPYGEHYRLGVSGPMPLDHLRPEVHHQLVSDLVRWAAAVPCTTSPKFKVIPGWGRIDSHLAQVASDKDADLLVVGTHQRNVAARLWHGSVSRQVIHEATCNVLCVPQTFAKSRIGTSPHTIVVPTDLSPLADRAILVAYSLLQGGGSLHLVHCGTHLTPADQDRVVAELRTRVPTEALHLGIQTELKVLDGETPWLAIWQYASRINADLICMATHSRDTGGNLLLGSQAQALLQHSRIPVLMVPPDRES